MSIGDWVRHFHNLYCRRNAVFLGGLGDRISHLQLAVGELQDAVRAGDYERQRRALASCFAWTCAVIGHFPDFPISEYLAKKYPAEGCAYCGHKPCQCQKKSRPEPNLIKLNPTQLSWSLEQWQDHLDKTYGTGNAHDGLENCLNRLFRETCEVRDVQMATTCSDLSVMEMEEHFGLELSDVLAWLIAIAYLLNISLGSVVVQYYHFSCPVCGDTPCSCGHFIVEQGKFKRMGLNKSSTFTP